MADNPDWEKILQFLKAQNGHYRREATDAEIEEEDFTPPQVAEWMLVEDLCGEINVNSGREHMREVLNYLDNTLGLVDFSRAKNTAVLKLEPDGFEIAHERELSKRQEETNTALVVFTVILVLVSWVGNFTDPSHRFAGNLIIGGTLIFLVFRTDVLELPSL